MVFYGFVMLRIVIDLCFVEDRLDFDLLSRVSSISDYGYGLEFFDFLA